MDEWINIVIRQLILYSLPVVISLTTVTFIESRFSRTTIPHPFFAISWRGTWLPLLASLALHRGIIIALPNPLSAGVKTASIRCLVHALLCLLGFCLYCWSLSQNMVQSAPAGLPPLHHWWLKVLMFFNLCMFSLHLLPLPGLVMGEWLLTSPWANKARHIKRYYVQSKHSWILITVLAASPLLDLALGALIVFPVYESMSSIAAHLAH